MTYRYEASTVAGFVQQFACCYVRHGYHHYVIGEIPEPKDVARVDAQLIERYGLEVSRFVRARRKRAGLANAQYLRFRRFFVLCATGPHGEHRFFDEHSAQQIRNIRETPVSFAGYSIGYHRGADRRWHPSVRIHPRRYRDLKAHFLDIAKRRTAADLGHDLRRIPFEPYAPVRRQLLALLRSVNRERKIAGLPPIPTPCFDFRRRIVRPFATDLQSVEREPEAA